MKVPEKVDLVKTNNRKELAPYDEDWFLVSIFQAGLASDQVPAEKAESVLPVQDAGGRGRGGGRGQIEETELCVLVPQLGAAEVQQLEQGHSLQGELEEEEQQCEGSFSTT